MTTWKASRGSGKASTQPCAKRRWQKNALGPTPPIGEKNGRKRSILVDERGVPLALSVSGANAHDVTLLEATLAAVVVKPPGSNAGEADTHGVENGEPVPKPEQHLCADAAYVGAPARALIEKSGRIPHVRKRKEEAVDKIKKPGHKARRWVVERTHSWVNRWRKLLVSFEKTEESFVGLLSLALALICWRQTIVIYG